MADLLTVIVSFALTGVVGNRLLQGWQNRNWLKQQEILNGEREYQELQGLFDEITRLAGARQHRMFRLANALHGASCEELDRYVTAYAEELIRWNERIATLYARLESQLGGGYDSKLEYIHDSFRKIGQSLEVFVRRRKSGMPVILADTAGVIADLNKLQGKIIEYHKLVLGEIRSRRKSMYRDDPLSLSNLDAIPTWDLFKALFERRVKPTNVI